MYHKKKIVRQVGYLPELYEDARYKKYIKKKIMLVYRVPTVHALSFRPYTSISK